MGGRHCYGQARLALKHFKIGKRMQEISFTAHAFKEGKIYVAYVPELDLSSCGSTDEEARKNIRDAVRGFVETSAEMGTLQEILEATGFSR